MESEDQSPEESPERPRSPRQNHLLQRSLYGIFDIRIRQCSRCRYWIDLKVKQDGFAAVGECHRHAPFPSGEVDDDVVAWPLTREYEICGEFKPKKTPD